MNDVPATLSVLGCLWVFAVLVMVGWTPRIINYLAKYSRVRALVLRQRQGKQSRIPPAELARFAVEAWLKPGDARRGLPEIPMIAGGSEIERMMTELYPRHRLAAAAFLIFLIGLTVVTSAFF